VLLKPQLALLLFLAIPGSATAGDPWRPPPPPADDLIYFVMVDRFANGDPTNDGEIAQGDPQAFHGGDIRGVIDHLDHLQALGVRTVWLSPVFDTRTDKFFEWGAFHGYWVEDFEGIEPKFGTAAQLRQLADELHARDMRLLLDVVYNHVAMDAPLTRERPDWFHPACDIVDWNDNLELTECRVHGLPDLDQENEEVYQHLLRTSLRWIDEVHPDGFRIDAVRHMRRDFLARLSADIRAHAGDGFQLLGEDFQGDALRLSRTFREGGFSAMFDFPLHYAMLDVYCHQRPVGRIAATLSADREYDDAGRLVPFLDNHDLPRVASLCADDPDAVRQALAFLLTTRGTPSLTYGTEVGLEGIEEPDNRADMRFEDRHPISDEIRALMSLRRANPALAAGGSRLLTLEGDFLAYARVAADQVVVILVNRGTTAVQWALPDGLAHATAVEDLVDGTTVAGGALASPPRSTRLYSLAGSFAEWAAAGATPSERAIHIELLGADPDAAGVLRLVGNGSALGNWDPTAGPGPLAPSARGFSLDMPYRVGEVMEFKVVRLRPDGNVDWLGGENRYLLVTPGAEPLELDVTW
jgi:glycosidase